jgi:HNH endonuclease
MEHYTDTGVGRHEEYLLANRAKWEADFLAKVDRVEDPDRCDMWLGRTNLSGRAAVGSKRIGYGMVNILGKNVLAHRMAYRLAGGDWHPVVMHKCDNPLCVKPGHLQGGTATENMRDAWVKGRMPTPRSEHLRDRNSHPKAKAVLADGVEYPSAALAAEAYGISRQVAAKRAKEFTKGWSYVGASRPWDDTTTEGHPGRPVIHGEEAFPSVEAAAAACGVDEFAVRNWCAAKVNGWRYA